MKNLRQHSVAAPPIRESCKLGERTQWGKIAAVGFRDGERYYMMIDKHGTVALMPGDVVEDVRAGVTARKKPATKAPNEVYRKGY